MLTVATSDLLLRISIVNVCLCIRKKCIEEMNVLEEDVLAEAMVRQVVL